LWEEEWTLREKKLAAAVGGLILLFIGVIIYFWTSDKPAEPAMTPYRPPADTAQAKEKKEKEKEEQPKELVVDVKGEVKQPGVYRFSPEDRVAEAVRKAGGPKKKADMERVNLAQPLSDGMALYIPAEGEEIPESIGEATDAGKSGESGDAPAIDVNTATLEELQELNGIGPSKAEAIISYREENGPFTSVDQLTEVSGIGEKTLEQLREQVKVN